jgi:FKBP-type peptidyl-prolyl cis-trans isomerase
MYYHAFLSNGVQFDSVKAPSPPAVFQTGRGSLIPGFEIGLEGMRIGGRRQIIVPPNLAYGLTDVTRNGAVIVPANSVLVFFVDLTDAAGGSGTTTTTSTTPAP